MMSFSWVPPDFMAVRGQIQAHVWTLFAMHSVKTTTFNLQLKRRYVILHFNCPYFIIFIIQFSWLIHHYKPIDLQVDSRLPAMAKSLCNPDILRDCCIAPYNPFLKKCATCYRFRKEVPYNNSGCTKLGLSSQMSQRPNNKRTVMQLTEMWQHNPHCLKSTERHTD